MKYNAVYFRKFGVNINATVFSFTQKPRTFSKHESFFTRKLRNVPERKIQRYENGKNSINGQ